MRPISPNLFPNDPHLVLCGVVGGSVCSGKKGEMSVLSVERKQFFYFKPLVPVVINLLGKWLVVC